MNLKARIELLGYGTSVGVRKEWDSRPRKQITTTPNEEHGIKLMNEVPHIHSIDMEMETPLSGNKLRFDREALKMVLRQAIQQLDQQDTGESPNIRYLNTPMGPQTYHDVSISWRPTRDDSGKPRMEAGAKK